MFAFNRSTSCRPREARYSAAHLRAHGVWVPAFARTTARQASRLRASRHVQQDFDRQSRRDRVPDHPHRTTARRAHGCGLFDGRRQGDACRHGGRGAPDRAAAAARELSVDPPHPRSGARERRAGDPSGLRLPGGECGFRRGLRRCRDRVHRAERRLDPRHRRQGQRQGPDGTRRHPDRARLSRRGAGRGPLRRGSAPDRLSGADQGSRRRRRARHAGGGRARRACGSARRRPARSSFGVRKRSAHHREISGSPASYRGAGFRRPSRPAGASIRARLLGPASPPEGARAGARPRPR